MNFVSSENGGIKDVTPGVTRSYEQYYVDEREYLAVKEELDRYRDTGLTPAEVESLQAQLATAEEGERAAVEDLKISAYCRTCAKKCGLSESLSKRMHEGGCRDYEWRGPAGEGGEQ